MCVCVHVSFRVTARQRKICKPIMHRFYHQKEIHLCLRICFWHKRVELRRNCTIYSSFFPLLHCISSPNLFSHLKMSSKKKLFHLFIIFHSSPFPFSFFFEEAFYNVKKDSTRHLFRKMNIPNVIHYVREEENERMNDMMSILLLCSSFLLLTWTHYANPLGKMNMYTNIPIPWTTYCRKNVQLDFPRAKLQEQKRKMEEEQQQQNKWKKSVTNGWRSGGLLFFIQTERKDGEEMRGEWELTRVAADADRE